MSEISVVGGGITGLASAYLAAKNPITVFEASKNIGGVLRDYNFHGNNFFSGCQYFNGESKWFNLMGLKQNFYQFDHTYGSWTDIFGNQTFSYDFAGPVFEAHDIKIDVPSEFLGESLADRCDLYPPKISGSLKKWFEFIGVDTDDTHHSSMTAFQASRIYVRGLDSDIKELKEKIGGIPDMIYGLPRSTIGLCTEKAFLPGNGFNRFFDDIFSVPNENIQVEKNNVVRHEIKNRRIILNTKDGNFDSDFVIWTADPTKLVYSVLGEKLDSKRFRADIINGFLDKTVTRPFYIQVYSFDSRVLRIYLYNIEGRGCFTIEKAFDDQDVNEVLNFCQSVITECLDYKILYATGRKKNIRYFSYTIKDYGALLNLQSHELENLIVPDYTIYGRDEKIDSIYMQLKDCCIV